MEELNKQIAALEGIQKIFLAKENKSIAELLKRYVPVSFVDDGKTEYSKGEDLLTYVKEDIKNCLFKHIEVDNLSILCFFSAAKKAPFLAYGNMEIVKKKFVEEYEKAKEGNEVIDLKKLLDEAVFFCNLFQEKAMPDGFDDFAEYLAYCFKEIIVIPKEIDYQQVQFYRSGGILFLLSNEWVVNRMANELVLYFNFIFENCLKDKVKYYDIIAVLVTFSGSVISAMSEDKEIFFSEDLSRELKKLNENISNAR